MKNDNLTNREMYDDVRHSNNERLFDRYLAATLILVLDWFQILF